MKPEINDRGLEIPTNRGKKISFWGLKRLPLYSDYIHQYVYSIFGEWEGISYGFDPGALKKADNEGLGLGLMNV